jgi:sigma-54-specific transcriptional regulator
MTVSRLPLGPRKLITLPNPEALALSIRAKALVFNDPQSQQLLEHIEQVAVTEATVLLIGETGTGKELVARHIHTASQRSGPFVAVNCGAFSETLVDAELFGHEAGAFTGASQARAGWFEAAQGGTLFLDEIGDMPMPLQVKLLRVLQERQVVRLGARHPIAVDVRLVAATNVDLAKAVQAGRFRADLFYRLHVATLPLPPLRERPGDILPLAEHFAETYGRKLGLPTVQFAAAAEDSLLAYAWPGTSASSRTSSTTR